MSDHPEANRAAKALHWISIGRPKFRRHTSTALALLLSAGLAISCTPAATPGPTAAPAKPAESKPAAAAPTTAPAAKPADPAKPAEAAKPAAARPEPQGSVILALNEEPPTLGANEASASYGYPVLRNVQEALVNRNQKNEVVGELATKWEQTNPTTWQFTLRQGVKFHDGSPFNAEAAAHGINYVWSKENNFRIRQFVGPEMNAKPAGEYVLDVVTESPDPILPVRLYFSPIPSMKALKESPADYPLKPIGTGPYKFVEWVKGQHVKLTNNPDWWGHAAADANGVASIKDATFLFRGEREVRTAMVKRDEAHLARWITPEQCKESPVCERAESVETIFMRFDTMNPLLKDQRAREAIALSIDKNAVINDIMGGGTVARQLVSSAVLGFNPELQPYAYDPAKAKQLVEQAKAAGVPIETPLTNYARRAYMVRIEEAAEAVSEMIKLVGIPNVSTRILETAAHTELWSAPKPIAPERGMIAVHAHGNELMDYSATLSSYYRCDGRLSTVCDPQLDEMITRASGLAGREREAAFHEIAKYTYDQVLTMPIGHPDYFYGVSSKLDWKPRLDAFILLKEMKLKS
jgi:peptide/nickel transport system substrate-binding protein